MPPDLSKGPDDIQAIPALVPAPEPSPTTDDKRRTVRATYPDLNYLEVVGALLYTCQTRPDLTFAVNKLTQFGSNPGVAHYEALKRVLCYLNGTAHFRLTFGCSGDAVDLVGWTDSDWPKTRIQGDRSVDLSSM